MYYVVVYLCTHMSVHVYIYIYIYIHTHTRILCRAMCPQPGIDSRSALQGGVRGGGVKRLIDKIK